MNYARDPLLALRLHSGNTICLAMCPRSRKHLKQIGSDASNLITVPITPKQWHRCTKCYYWSHKLSVNFMKYLMLLRIFILMLSSLQKLSWLVMFQTRKWLVMWLQLVIHSIMQLGFTRKLGESAFFSAILWNVKPTCTFSLSLLKTTNWHLYLGDKCSSGLASLWHNAKNHGLIQSLWHFQDTPEK